MDRAYVRARMKQGAIIGFIVGIALFGVAFASWRSLFHVIFVPITTLIGYYTPKLLADPDDLE